MLQGRAALTQRSCTLFVGLRLRRVLDVGPTPVSHAQAPQVLVRLCCLVNQRQSLKNNAGVILCNSDGLGVTHSEGLESEQCYFLWLLGALTLLP